MVVCVNCGLEVLTLYHVYNEVNYCLATCENCGEICDKYVEWEIPLIIIDLFLFKIQVYRHLIHNHSPSPPLSPSLSPTHSTVHNNTPSLSPSLSPSPNTTYNTVHSSVGSSMGGVRRVGLRIRSTLVRVMLLLISATILDSYSMLTSCNYLTSPPNICFPQFQSYNQSLLTQTSKFFRTQTIHNRISNRISNRNSNLSQGFTNRVSGFTNVFDSIYEPTSGSSNVSKGASSRTSGVSGVSEGKSEVLELVEKMSSAMMCYSRLNIFKRVGMNAEYCNRTYSRAMELFFLIFLQNPTLCSWSKNLTADCKDITELGIISLSILRVLSYCLYVIIFYTILRRFKLITHKRRINRKKRRINEKDDNLCDKKINAKVDRVRNLRGKYHTNSAAENDSTVTPLSTVETTVSTGLKGVLNMFYALLLSFHIKSLVLMINVWYPTHTILIVIELYIYLNHIVELKAISNLSLGVSAFIVVTGALLKIAIYFLWFHIINTLNLHYFYS